MGRYLSANLCSSSVKKTLRSYCKIRYLMSLLRKYPRLGKAPLCLDLHRNSLLSPPHSSRFTRKPKSLKNVDTNSTSYHFQRVFSKEVKHPQFVRFYSSSNRNTFKAEAPIGIFEEAQSGVNLSSLGGRLGQSFNRWSRHINVYFKRQDVAPLAENVCLVVTTPDYLGRSQRRSQSQRAARERKITEGKDMTETSKDRQESSRTSATAQGASKLQLFHISTLATTFGESYSYVANHINSVFSRGSSKAQMLENLETMPSSSGTNRRHVRRKLQNTKEAEMPQVKSAAVEADTISSSWEEGYLHFARHINKYFGAKVTDDIDQNRHRGENNTSYKIHLSTQSTSQTQGAISQLKHKEPLTPENGGLFHSSCNTTNFGENYFQTAGHINQYFKGQSGSDEDTDRNFFIEVDAGPATSEKTVSFMDYLRRPTSAIPDMLGAFLNLGPLTQTGKQKPAMASPAILNKKVTLCLVVSN